MIVVLLKRLDYYQTVDVYAAIVNSSERVTIKETFISLKSAREPPQSVC